MRGSSDFDPSRHEAHHLDGDGLHGSRWAGYAAFAEVSRNATTGKSFGTSRATLM
jgi:hypothetical protein